MTSLDDAIVARIERGGTKFEIFVDPELAWEIRRGKKEYDPSVLAVDEIFRDARSGERPSEEDMILAFETTELSKIAERIIKKGDLSLTAEQKKRKSDEKRKQIVEKIAKNAVNPQTGMPHPPDRIKSALESANVNIDPFLPAAEQIKDAVDAIRVILPLSFEKKRYRLNLPPVQATKCYGDVKRVAEINKENWLDDGHLILEIEVSAGDSTELIDILNKKTHGTLMIEEI